MKLTSIWSASLLFLVCWASPVLAVTMTKASANATAQVWDQAIRFAPGGLRSTPRHDEDLGESGESLEVHAFTDLQVEGDVQALALGDANAAIGKLGVKVRGFALGARRFRNINGSSLAGFGASIASASATWVDTVSLSYPGHRFINATYNVLMEGDLNVNATGQASSEVSFNLTNAQGSALNVPEGPLGGPGWGSARIHPLLGPEQNEIPGGFRVFLSVETGTPVPIGLSIGLSGHSESHFDPLASNQWSNDIAEFTGEVSRSIKWGGVESVFDAVTGEELDPDFLTIASESGFDYTKPFQIPEPGTTSLLVFGIGLLMFRVRKGDIWSDNLKPFLELIPEPYDR